MIASVHVALSFRLLSPDCVVLQEVGKSTPFEIAVGQNGRVWVHSNSNVQTMLIANAILNCEFLSPAQTRDMVQQLFKRAAVLKTEK
jgi:exosome complex component RRP40